MRILQNILKRLTFTHFFLFLIAIGLLMNWAELRGINTNLRRVGVNADQIETDLSSTESDLSSMDLTLKDIEIDLSH
ncbi:MAG: hypothetical protein P4K83_00625 [Terracidiphilus sp.]|nr:hypothetical protein [Terracidiphilus sp.]